MADFVPTHRPVLGPETIEALAPAPGKLLLDGTVGLGGHAALWLEASAPDGRVLGLDRDPDALAVAAERLAPYGERVTLVHADYRDAIDVLAARNGAGAGAGAAGGGAGAAPDAILLDLGLGSHQIDDPERGFSFRFDGPLDMRFDRSRPARTAADVLNHTSEPELVRIFSEYGEFPAAKKLARLVVETRKHRKFAVTGDLVRVAHEAVPPRGHKRIDPSTLAFQALRIAVNEELDGLGQTIEDLVRTLAPGGRIAIIAFHSLEDRVSKQTLRRLAEPCRCRRGDPCTCGALQLLELSDRRAVKTTEDEAYANPRARSARLRWGIRR